MPPAGANVVQALRVGPGELRWAPLGSPIPADLDTPWDAAWSGLGYTEDGHEMERAGTFEERRVAEELLALATYQTEATGNMRFALAQINTDNLQLMFGGGSVAAPGADGSVVYTPPAAGEFTDIMLGWEADDTPHPLERIVFTRVTQVGAVTVPRRRAPQAANLPLDFKMGVPDGGGPPLHWILASELVSA